MRIVVYSTNSNRFEAADYEITSFPTRAREWEAVASAYPEHRFVLATQLPGSFLLDLSGGGLGEKAASVEYVMLRGTSPASLADEIASFSPDLAVAYSFWEPPFDWMALQDSMIGERLREKGICVLCNPSASQLLCFDKAESSRFLAARGFHCARCVHVKRELYWCERGSSAIESNVYKEYIFRELETLRYPVIVKPAYGLSSYSMLKAVSPRQVIACLNSGKTKTDSLVEEYIDGIQAGAEIYGRKGAYTVLPPFLFSTDKWGITSPKQGIKLGPVTGLPADGAAGGNGAGAGPANVASPDASDSVDAGNVPDSPGLQLRRSVAGLSETLTRLATELELDGVAQVDLVFSGGNWYIIEVNPRLSGLSDTDAVAFGKSPIERMLEAALGGGDRGNGDKAVCSDKADCGRPPACQPLCGWQEIPRPVCNFKIPIMPPEDLRKIAALPYICAVRQLENKAARQKREVGYSEIIIEGEEVFASIARHLEELERLFPGSIDGTFFAKFTEMAGLLE
ncbi:MAG: ATP-grasp domain-containing protein [Treponema sp.]|nr:ATP-grasp domain-containing protein [Treponema sp.]